MIMSKMVHTLLYGFCLGHPANTSYDVDVETLLYLFAMSCFIGNSMWGWMPAQYEIVYNA